MKSAVRKIEGEKGVLIFDGTISEKMWTDENEIVCWHYDHKKGRTVKGINLLNALYHKSDISLPVAFAVIKKLLQFCDVATHQFKRASLVMENELMRTMLAACMANQLKFRYVLMDSWCAARENFEFMSEKESISIAALKDNRLVALSQADKAQGRCERTDRVSLLKKQAVRSWLKGYGKEVLLVRQVFTNKDSRTGILDLVCSNLTLGVEHVTTIYQKRWNVEVFHKSLKSNAGLAKSPTQIVTTQSNHVFISIVAVFKLECLKIQHHLNYFALRAKLLIKATQRAYEQLQALRLA